MVTASELIGKKTTNIIHRFSFKKKISLKNAQGKASAGKEVKMKPLEEEELELLK